MLEHPDSILNNFFNSQIKKKPLLWIRGFQPCYTPVRIDNNTLDNIGVFRNKVLDFNSKWVCRKSYLDQFKIVRYCKGYTSDDTLVKLKKIQLKTDFINENHKFIFDSLCNESTYLKDIDCLVVSKKTKLNLIDIKCKVIYWEDFTYGFHESLTDKIKKLFDVLNTLNLNIDATLHIIPFCYEDEGEAYFKSLNIIKFHTITYLPNIFDFIDLKDNVIN